MTGEMMATLVITLREIVKDGQKAFTILPSDDHVIKTFKFYTRHLVKLFQDSENLTDYKDNRVNAFVTFLIHADAKMNGKFIDMLIYHGWRDADFDAMVNQDVSEFEDEGHYLVFMNVLKHAHNVVKSY